jgi:hypothetical protein
VLVAVAAVYAARQLLTKEEMGQQINKAIE